jgi:hypothetical protein
MKWGKTRSPKTIQGKIKRGKLTNVRMIPHVLDSTIREIPHQKLCHVLILALKPRRLPIVPLLILIPRRVNLPQRCADNAATGLIHQLHPHVTWVRVHGFDKVCFYFCALFRCVGAEEGLVQRHNAEGEVLDFEKFVEVGLRDTGHFEMHFGDWRSVLAWEMFNGRWRFEELVFGENWLKCM